MSSPPSGDLIRERWPSLTSPGPLVSEDETLPVFVIQSDGSGMRQIGETDAARRIQYVSDGEVAFQYQGDLHVVQPDTGADEVVTQLASDPTSDSPFVFSPDGGGVCLVRGYSVSVLDRSSGIEAVLSESIDIRRWQPCAWSPDGGFLAFADQTRKTGIRSCISTTERPAKSKSFCAMTAAATPGHMREREHALSAV